MPPLTGDSNAQNTAGVLGTNTAGGVGVRGVSDTFEGVHGDSSSPNTAAVAGVNNAAQGSIGTWGQSDPGRGVVGVSKSGTGVFGHSDTFEGVHGDSTSPNTAAVAGINNAAQGSIGTFGQSDPGRGVVGVSKSGTGVYGTSQSFEGVHGETSGGAAGVAGFNHGPGPGVWGKSAGGPAAFFDGDVRVTGDIQLVDAHDLAEEFDVSFAEVADPGTVMVLDDHGILAQSRAPYDKRVVGVVSGAGTYRPGVILGSSGPDIPRVRLALLGKVFCKVDASGDAIAVGDLLTTSPVLGHAMKAGDQVRSVGAVIGKALRPLQTGRALIPILVTLQ